MSRIPKEPVRHARSLRAGMLALSLSLSLIADDVDISFVRIQSLPLYKAP